MITRRFNKFIATLSVLSLVLSGGFEVALPDAQAETSPMALFPQIDVDKAKEVEIDFNKIEVLGPPLSQEKPKARVTKIELKKGKPDHEDVRSVLPDPVGSGVDFLAQNQNADGSWAPDGKTAMVETAAVTQLLRELNQKVPIETQQTIDSALPLTRDWFALSFPENNDYVAKKLFALVQAGEEVGSLDDFLAAQINEFDLGFGYQKRFGSDPITTVQVLKALTSNGYTDPGSDPYFTLNAALSYLVNTQNLDGGWPLIQGNESAIFAANEVLETLLSYHNPEATGVLQTAIELGLNYLQNQQQANGAWQDDLLATALSYHTLRSYRKEPTYNQEALDYLLESQSADGSFENQNFYKTAKALQAVAKPDVAVTDIQNISDLLPNQPTAISVFVTNKGFVNADPLNFAVDPSAFILTIDDQETILDFSDCDGSPCPPTIVLEPNATLELQILINGLPFGLHTVKFQVVYNGVELNANNNSLIEELMFDNPLFVGPEPPPWAGASTSGTPRRIVVVWHPSQDSATTHYYVFIGSSPGNYFTYIDTDTVAGCGGGVCTGLNIGLFSDGVPYYFSVAAVDANNIRGDYSKETWAAAYNSPGNQVGTLSGNVRDNNGNGIPQAAIAFYGFVNEFQTNAQGFYSIANIFPGLYWATASHASYSSASQEVQIKTQQTTNYDFTLEIIDDGLVPAPITGLTAQPDNGQITLTWDQFQNTSGDFKHFNIYRSFNPIADVSQLTPIDESITNANISTFTDMTIVNGIPYSYAVAAEDLAGNFNPAVQGTDSVRGNSPPQITNPSAYQSGQNVIISYDVADAEQSSANISFQYWDGTNWQDVQTAIGQDNISMGVARNGVWHAKQDFPGFDDQTKVKITANDGESVQATTNAETPLFALDTKDLSVPTVDSFLPATNDFTQTISGTKEPNSAIYINGAEAVPLDAASVWSANVTLAEGANLFSIRARDAVGNESSPLEITITYDPDMCVPPLSGDWVITEDCMLEQNVMVPAHVIVQDDAILTVANGASLNIDFSNYHLLVKYGSRVVIKQGAKIY